MTDSVEAVRGGVALVFSGFILLVIAQAVGNTALDTGVVEIGLIGIVAILGGGLVLVTVVAVLVGRLLP